MALGTCIFLEASASLTQVEDNSIPAVHTNAAFPLICYPGNRDQNANKLGAVILLLPGMLTGQMLANFLKVFIIPVAMGGALRVEGICSFGKKIRFYYVKRSIIRIFLMSS